MPRLLLIDPDRDGLDALHAALRRAGFDDVATVTSGAFALTTLERNRPDVIVSRAGVPDIDGYELYAIVRNDPSMTGVLFLLLEGPGDHAPEPRHEDKPDQVLAGDLPLATIVSAVAGLLQRDDATEADGAQGTFAFEALTALPANAMRTIDRDLKQLLMSAAIGIDEGRTGAAVAPSRRRV